MVIMDTEYYRDKLVLQDHLNQPTYETTRNDIDKIVFKKQRKLMDKHRDCLTDKEFKFITDYKWKSSNFYVNPKIAKNKEIGSKMQSNNRGGSKLVIPVTRNRSDKSKYTQIAVIPCKSVVKFVLSTIKSPKVTGQENL